VASAAAVASAAESDASDDFESDILATYAAAQDPITLRFNHPAAEAAADADAAATFAIQVRHGNTKTRAANGSSFMPNAVPLL
jgi:hypothetical protein